MALFNDRLKSQLKDIAADAKVLANNKKEQMVDMGRDALVKAGDAAEDARLKAQKKLLAPVFADDLAGMEYPQMVHICEPDRQHLNSPVCEGSIGYMAEAEGMDVLNVYPQYVGMLGVQFYPYDLEDVYYVDPANPKAYVCLDEYFAYMKKVRVDELNRIAQELGAKHIKVSIKAEKKSFVGEKQKGRLNLGALLNNAMDLDSHSSAYEKVEVASELRFAGHEPHVPTLEYFRNDRDIKSLIAMRMDNTNPLQYKTITMNFSTTTGMNKNDAVKIEGVLRKLKLGGNASIVSAVEEENRQHFEYYISFVDEQ